MRCAEEKLLEQLNDRGYPLEYLLSRIRGRRAELIRDWRPLLSGTSIMEDTLPKRYRGMHAESPAEAVWRRLIQEYRWVYSQMNMRLRNVFCPFFLYSEIRTIFICMRHIKAKTPGRTDKLLDASLLSRGIKDGLRYGDDPAKAAVAIERSFILITDEFGGLSGIAASNGLLEFERTLVNTYLRHVLKERLHPMIRDFFIQIIDARNIISLYKYLRFEAAASPPFLPGGRTDIERLERILHKGDIFGLVELAVEITGTDVDVSSVVQIEKALYASITRHIRKEGMDPLGAGVILDYLWRCSIEAMNLSTIFYLKDVERESVESELII